MVDRWARVPDDAIRSCLRQVVGWRQPNRPGDVATVEAMVRSTGDLDFRRDHQPTGLFSVPLRDAIGGFQRRSGLTVDRIVNPDGETFRSLVSELDLDDAETHGDIVADLEDPDEATQRALRCQEIAVDLGNAALNLEQVEREIDDAGGQLGAAVDRVRNAEALPTDIALMAASIGISLAARDLPAVLLQTLVLVERLAGFETDLNVESRTLNRIADRLSDLLERRDRVKREMADLQAEGDGLGCSSVSL